MKRQTNIYYSSNIVGKTFGILTVVAETNKRQHRNKIYNVYCSKCGGYHLLRRDAIVTERFKCKQSRHGMSRTPEYRTYMSARARCIYPCVASYKYYGAKGVKFLFNDFNEFFAEVGLKPTPLHSIDRIDPFGNYEPGNIRWSTQEEQANNTRKKAASLAA